MSDKVPLLNLQQIQELTNMVRSIQADNTKTLETILSETIQIEQTTILTIYNLVVQEWKKKQTVVDNLCHFTLTMMSTVEVLWQQRYDQEDKISNAEVVIQYLNKNIYQLGDENEGYKQKIKDAQIQLFSVTQQKQRIQQFCRSQSCIGFNQEFQNQDLKTLNKYCSACSQMDIKVEEKNSQIKHKSEKFIEKKLYELTQVLDEKKQLQQEFNLLKEEHSLTRMELQLAEIAIKEALTYKNSYLSLMSNLSETSHSVPKSNIDDNQVNDAQDLIEKVSLQTHVLALEIPIQGILKLQSHSKQYEQIHNNQFLNSSDYSLVRLSGKEDKKTTHQSSFKKKEENRQKFQKQIGNELSICQLKENSKIKSKQSRFENQIENYNSSFKGLNQTYHPTTRLQSQRIDLYPKEVKVKGSMRLVRQTVKKEAENKKKMQKQKYNQANSSQSSLGKLYTLIARKIVTSRIKKK